jgi:hypothetical protein
MPQIAPYRFGLDLIAGVGFRSGGQGGESRGLTGGGKGFGEIGSGSSDSGDAELLAANGGDDDDRGTTAS